MTFQTITVKTDGPVALITLNRPTAMNAVCGAMLSETADAFDALEKEDAVRVVVLTGDKTYFAAGTDVLELAGENADAAFDAYARFLKTALTFKKPVIAAVAGYAFGAGFELALLADIVIAGDNARFGFPEITLGVLPQLGGAALLAARIGKTKAAEMIMTGRHLSAEEAFAAQIASRVVDASLLIDEAFQTAFRIAQMPSFAVQAAKKAVCGIAETAENQAVCQQTAARLSFLTPEAKEALAALSEKRAPDFSKTRV